MIKKRHMSSTKIRELLIQNNRYRYVVISILIISCLFLIYLFHILQHKESLFSHFFYMPIILAALWWRKRGISVAVSLALVLIISHHIFADFSITINDYFRAVMFILVSITIALLSENLTFNLKKYNKANRALIVYSECNRAVIYAADEDQMLQDVCRAIVSKGGYRFAWIGFKQNDPDKSVHPVAQAGHGRGYTKDLGVSWGEQPQIRGMTGETIRNGIVTIIRSIDTDPAFKPWRDLALDRGFLSAISIPLTIKDEIIGSLSIYATEPDAFDEEEVSLLKELARDLSFGIDSIRTQDSQKKVEEELRDYRNRLEELVEERTQKLEQTYSELEEYKGNLEIIVDSRTDALRKEIEEHKETSKQLREYRDHLEELVEMRTRELKDANESLTAENLQKEWFCKNLEDKTRELESFVHTASHDLKAPLVLLGGYTSRLIKQYSDVLDNDAINYLEVLKLNVQRMEELIRDLLELSRVGKVVDDFILVDVEAIVDDIYATIKPILDEHGIDFRIARPLPRIYGNTGLIRQIFTNLITNAIKFIGNTDAPYIEVGSAQNSEDHIKYYVSDNGIGIDPNNHELIFKEFHRIKEIESEGTGIGLAIVKKIVEHYNGVIWVDSQQGKGSTFYFVLPNTDKKIEIQKLSLP